LGLILIVDDDTRLRTSFERLLISAGHKIVTASSGEDGLVAVEKYRPELVVMDVRLPGMNGLEALAALHERDSRLPVIIMTAFSTTDTAIEATKRGAFDYVLKPFKPEEMLDLIDTALEASDRMRSQVQINGGAITDIGEALIGRSEAMQEVFKSIGRAAATDATVLIRGASGTGKELVARAIYQHSPRKERPFTVINCVAIPETLLESELFGYESGAFTGATHRKIGKIEQAEGGTVLLDEVGDMSPLIQAKILRLLQEKSLERLGGNEIIPVDVRILAATNRNLEKALAEGLFREDLYYRMRVVTIDLPTLAERGDDIDILADYFLNRFANELSCDNPGLSDEARAALRSHDWPGNVRELSNTLQKALIFSRGFAIQVKDLALEEYRNESETSHRDWESLMRQMVREKIRSESDRDVLTQVRDQVTRIAILEALEITDNNRSQAARLLGITRPTLHAKMEQLGITKGSESRGKEEA